MEKVRFYCKTWPYVPITSATKAAEFIIIQVIEKAGRHFYWGFTTMCSQFVMLKKILLTPTVCFGRPHRDFSQKTKNTTSQRSSSICPSVHLSMVLQDFCNPVLKLWEVSLNSHPFNGNWN